MGLYGISFLVVLLENFRTVSDIGSEHCPGNCAEVD